MGIEKGILANVLRIRKKMTDGKPLDKYEREYYANNHTLIDLEQPYTEGQAEAIRDVMEWMEG